MLYYNIIKSYILSDVRAFKINKIIPTILSIMCILIYADVSSKIIYNERTRDIERDKF